MGKVVTMVSGDVSGETVRPKRLGKASPLQIDRGCTRRRLGRRSRNIDISLVLADISWYTTAAALVDGSDVEAEMLIYHWF